MVGFNLSSRWRKKVEVRSERMSKIKTNYQLTRMSWFLVLDSKTDLP